MSGRPSLEIVTAGEIDGFAVHERESAPPGSVVPISLSRAKAWARNPHAQPGDTVLMVARIERRCVGYLGLLPGLLREGEQVEAMSWFSTFYVPPEWRDQAVGGLLLMRALTLGRSLAVAHPSDEAARTFQSVGFAPRPVPWLMLDVQSSRNWCSLPLRAARRAARRSQRPVPARLDGAITAGGRISAFGLVHLLAAAARRRFGRWDTRTLPRAPAPLPPADGRPHAVRDQPLLQWMLDHPWVTTDRRLSDPAYYFDDYRTEAVHHVLEVRRDGGSLGWMILGFDATVTQRRLRVLDLGIDPLLPADARGEAILAVTLDLALEHRADLVLVPGICAPALRRLGPAGRLFEYHPRIDFHRPHPGIDAGGLLARIETSPVDGDAAYA